MTLETRTAGEVRAAGRKLVGYAATFGAEARIHDFTETIRAGAFAGSLGGDVLALVDHDRGRLLGRTKSGTLRLKEDERGLAFELDVPDTALGRDLLTMAARSDLGGMSFGFTVEPDGEEWRGDRRTLKRVALHEISVVQSHPAYGGTTVSARSRAERTAADRRIARLALEAVR